MENVHLQNITIEISTMQMTKYSACLQTAVPGSRSVACLLADRLVSLSKGGDALR